MFCREHVVQLHCEIRAIRDAGAELYVIGNGAPTFIEGFRETTGYTGVVYTDPSLAVFAAARLKRGVGTMLSLGVVKRGLSTLRRGFRQGVTHGDNLQQGGVLVIGRDGRVLWQHVSDAPGDNADPADVVRAVRNA
jgi:hypothetical protein